MSLGAALIWKYGPVVSCNMDKGEITSWRHETLPEPDPDEFPQILADYAIYFAKKTKTDAIDDLRDAKKSLPISSQGHQIDTGDVDAGVMATKIHAASLNSKTIVSITNDGGTATATTSKNHHIKTDGTVTIAGADQSEYNTTATATATGKKTFTYPIAGNPDPATGTITFAPDTMRFIPATNEVLFVGADVFREIYLDVEEYVDECQINARELKNEVLEATTIAGVDAVDLDAGWPDTGI